jgi:histidinol phosphatase-like PHP family hydrolase
MQLEYTERNMQDRMRIDLHVHCSERSACGRSTEEEQIMAAIDSGLDAIAFTDHNRLVPESHIQELNERYSPFRVFGGIEINVSEEDIIILGVHDPSMEVRKWTYRGLYDFVRQNGGYMALAHPFRYHDTINIDLENLAPDAIEMMSNNTPGAAAERIYQIASSLSIPVLCNSDSHRSSNIGRYYNVIDRFAEDEMELIHLLKSGEFRCSIECI